MSRYIVKTKNLVKHFNKGEIKAVDGLDLEIKQGEIYAFIGANGTGKSTALNMISGVLAPTSGSIEVMGLEMPKKRNIVTKYMGVAPQEYSVYLDLTVEENILFFADLFGVDDEIAQTQMEELTKVLRLDQRKNDVAKTLSGGMKRRLSIACSLIHDPQLVIFDEATVGVDPVLRQWFWDYFQSLRERGTTIIITSHVMDEAERADRIGLLRAGKLIEEGTPKELKAKYQVGTIEEIFLILSKGEVSDE
ncbi:MAG: ABC transporter ATP-binding protein [Candidatus Kariarchaeaceae archaeon]|jgi:ABC-2 type transport system ATP-binding protein